MGDFDISKFKPIQKSNENVCSEKLFLSQKSDDVALSLFENYAKELKQEETGLKVEKNSAKQQLNLKQTIENLDKNLDKNFKAFNDYEKTKGLWGEIADIPLSLIDLNEDDVLKSLNATKIATDSLKTKVENGEDFQVAFKEVFNVDYSEHSVSEAKNAQDIYDRAFSEIELRDGIRNIFEDNKTQALSRLARNPVGFNSLDSVKTINEARHKSLIQIAGGQNNFDKIISENLEIRNYKNLPQSVKDEIDKQLEMRVRAYFDSNVESALNGKTIEELRENRNEKLEKAYGEYGKDEQLVQDYKKYNKNVSSGLSIATTVGVLIATKGAGTALANAGLSAKSAGALATAGNLMFYAGVEEADVLMTASNGGHKDFNWLTVVIGAIPIGGVGKGVSTVVEKSAAAMVEKSFLKNSSKSLAKNAVEIVDTSVSFAKMSTLSELVNLTVQNNDNVIERPLDENDNYDKSINLQNIYDGVNIEEIVDEDYVSTKNLGLFTKTDFKYAQGSEILPNASKSTPYYEYENVKYVKISDDKAIPLRMARALAANDLF